MQVFSARSTASQISRSERGNIPAISRQATRLNEETIGSRGSGSPFSHEDCPKIVSENSLSKIICRLGLAQHALV
eukprot:3054335-Amphidinium_carterae.1